MSWYHLASPALQSAGLTSQDNLAWPGNEGPTARFTCPKGAFCSHLEGGEHRWVRRRVFTISPGSLGHLAVLVPCRRFCVYRDYSAGWGKKQVNRLGIAWKPC